MKTVSCFLRKLTILALALGAYVPLSAQTYKYSHHHRFGEETSFHVVAIKGSVKAERQDGTWTSIRVRDTIGYSQRIWLDDNSYIGLVSRNGRAIELKSKGLVSVNYVTSPKPDLVTSRYTGYVINQAVSSGAGRHSGKTLGAVTRSTLAPLPQTPPGTMYFAENIVFYWVKQYPTCGYIIKILDYYGNIIETIEIPEHYNSWSVCADKLNLKSGKTYYWRIARKDMPNLLSDPVSFSIYSEKEANKIKEELSELLMNIDEETATGLIILGSFYRHYNMHAYSIDCYEKAELLEPDIITE